MLRDEEIQLLTREKERLLLLKYESSLIKIEIAASSIQEEPQATEPWGLMPQHSQLLRK